VRQPHDRIEQREARRHRDDQSARARGALPLGRQPPDQDREEDQVVDAEDDLERGERQEREPGMQGAA